jgi:hypothetical protein
VFFERERELFCKCVRGSEKGMIFYIPVRNLISVVTVVVFVVVVVVVVVRWVKI